MSMLERARPELLALRGYSSARMEGAREGVLLNANESAWPSAIDAGGVLQRYPEGRRPQRLLRLMAAYYGVAPAAIAVTRGSDDAIDALTRAFCAAGRDTVLVTPPTFAMYAVSAAIQGAAVRAVPLRRDAGFALDVDAVLAAVDATTKLLWLCSPNNPTGSVVPRASVLALAEALRGRVLVVVDEAYVEFADGPSLAGAVAGRANLAVLRTLSKAHALAGARVGALLAAPELIELVERLLPPYPLATPSLQAAERALDAAALAATRARIEAARGERERLAAALRGVRGVRAVLPSQANFVAVRFDDARATCARLAAAGIVVRDATQYAGLDDVLRVSVGRPEDNARLLAVLDDAAPAPRAEAVR